MVQTAMHISSNFSHWVCVFMGLFLIVTGLVSHVARQTVSVAARVYGSNTGGGFKRAVIIGIGLFAVGYGVSRVLG